MKHPMAVSFALVVAAALARPLPAGAAKLSEGSWATSSVQVDYRDVPLPPLVPPWARSPVAVDGKVVWVVARLAPSVTTWGERLLQGSEQAQQRLFATAKNAVARRWAGLGPAQRERSVEEASERFKLLLDRESYVEVETAERPDAVWMRFGYPVDRVEQALGFAIPGAATASAGVPIVASPRAASHLDHPISDYVWESSWIAGVVAITVLVFGVAASLGR